MNKILIILIVILVLGVGTFFGFRSFQKHTELQGILKVRVHPAETTLKINNKIYQNRQGLFNIKLNPGQHSLFLSCPDYSFWEDKIIIKSKETTELSDIYLFPNNWPKETIVTGEKIEHFYLSPDSNRIFYIEKSSKYDWYIFDRNSKQKEHFLETSSLPNSVDFSSKKILVNLGKNDWKIIFLAASLIKNNISLNTSLKQALDQAGIRQKETSLVIERAVFYPKNDNDIIIKTPDAIYLLNFLTESIEKIYEGKSSPFIAENEYVYFIKENGVFSAISLQAKEEIETSLYSFSLENLEKTKIRKKKDDNKFLIIEGTQKAYFEQSEKQGSPERSEGGSYYLETFQGFPTQIGNYLIDGIFSFDKKEILLSSEDKIEIYNLESGIKSSEKLYSDVPAIWFLNNEHLLFLKDRMLNIYTLKNNKIWPIANDVKNNNFFYDPSINYVFYLSDAGIIKVSL